ncbi:YjbQ family protein [Streptococcus porcinus]
MTVYQSQFSLNTHAQRDSYFDVTSQVRTVLAESHIQNGMVYVTTPHTTCAIFFEEWTHDSDTNGDDFLNLDLSKALERIFPPHTSSETYHYPGEAHYRAVESWPNPEQWLPGGDRRALWNADAHLKASLIGASEMVPVKQNSLAIGKTGYIYFVDFDRTRERERRVQVTIIGD